MRPPSIEVLEPRIAPATFIVTSLDDAGEGTLRDAISEANANSGADLIVFRKGLTGTIDVQSQMEITDPLTIRGPGSGKVVLDAVSRSRFFAVSDDDPQTDSPLSISGLTLIRGEDAQIDPSGGAMICAESLKIRNCVFMGSHSFRSGGAILVNEGDGVPLTVDIRGSSFVENHCTNSGGALFIIVSGGLTLKNNFFSGNFSDDKSGAIALVSDSDKPALVQKCQFIGNNAVIRAGAGTIIGTMIVRDSLFEGNFGTAVGGLDLSGERIVIDGSEFIQNRAHSEGAGLNVLGFDSFILRSSRIIGNGTFDTESAGGLNILIQENAMARIVGSTISGNTATQGGGLFADGSNGRLEVAGSRISNNHVNVDGAGMLVRGGITFVMIGSKVTGNYSFDGFGAGVALFTSLPATIISSIIANNTGRAGSGISVTGDLTITDSVVTSNFAGFRAGILFGEQLVEFKRTKVFGNVSQDRLQIGGMAPGI